MSASTPLVDEYLARVYRKIVFFSTPSAEVLSENMTKSKIGLTFSSDDIVNDGVHSAGYSVD
jgi:hypothetical protein